MASTHQLQASSASPKATSTKLHHSTPRPRLTAAKRVPLTSWETFEAAHRATKTKLTDYLAAGRKRSIRLERAVLDELDPSAAMALYANNTDARLVFAAVAKRHIAKLAEGDEEIRLFWVTLIPKQFVVREDAAAAFNPKRLHAWTHQVLRGLSYVGMVEAALYTNLTVLMSGYRRTVSWHAHLIVWGAGEARVQQIMRNINQRYAALLPGVDPAYAVPVTGEEALGKTLYMLKAPQSEHRVYPRKVEEIDYETGEVSKRSTGRFKQKKRALRPRDLAKVCKVLADKHLDQLAFAGGQGTPVLKAIRAEAMQPLRASMAREAALRAARSSPPKRPRQSRASRPRPR